MKKNTKDPKIQRYIDFRRARKAARTRLINKTTRKMAAEIMREIERQGNENKPPIAVLTQMRAEELIRPILEDVIE